MKIGTAKFTIGTDAEMFCVDKNGYVAVQNCGIKGTKKDPQPLPMGSNVQRDNVAVEFAVPPAASKDEFIRNIGDALDDVIDVLPNDVQIEIIPSANFPANQLVHDECKEFGCDPDSNAWTRQVNQPAADAAEAHLRSCAAHIHLGFVVGSGNYFLEADEDAKAMVICVMDCMLGLVSTVLDGSEAATRRKELYGKAGCWRSREYGIEYRTLSNYWIKSPTLVSLIYSLVEDVIEVMRDEKQMELINRLGVMNIRNVITNGEVEMAEKMVNGVVMEYMSTNSIALYKEVLGTVEDINFKEAWRIAA